MWVLSAVDGAVLGEWAGCLPLPARGIECDRILPHLPALCLRLPGVAEAPSPMDAGAFLKDAAVTATYDPDQSGSVIADTEGREKIVIA